MTDNKKHGFKNKDAVEFMLVNRGIDDPHYREENASDKILLLIPKDKTEDSLKAKHEEIIKQIPEINRGVYNEETFNFNKEIIKYSKNGEAILPSEPKNEEKKVVINLVNNKVYEFEKHSSNPTIIDKNILKTETKTKPIELKFTSEEEIINLDDKKIDEIFRRVKLPSDIKTIEYNEFGLPKNIDPEVLKYITNKEFKEGVDEFIPATKVIQTNNYDIDIKPEDMDDEHKELFDAIERKYEGYEEIEDNFIMIANAGKLPINLLDPASIKEIEKKNEDEMLTLNKKIDDKKKPKYITEEEREFLDKKFNHCFESEYKNNETKDGKKEKISDKVLNEALDELLKKEKKSEKKEKLDKFDDEEFEEYEYEDEEEEFEDYEDDEDNDEKDIEAIRRANQGKIKIEYIEKKKPKDNINKKNKTEEEELNEDLNKLMVDEDMIKKTMILLEASKSDKEEDEEEENHYIKKPKVFENIETNQSMNNKGNLPKIIPASFKKQNKNEINISVKDKKALLENINKDNANKEYKVKIENKGEKEKGKINKIDEEETKEEKALRKKLVKEERKQKRQQKKQLKEAYTNEKLKQMKNIATMNQSLSYGVSVKEI